MKKLLVFVISVLVMMPSICWSQGKIESPKTKEFVKKEKNSLNSKSGRNKHLLLNKIENIEGQLLKFEQDTILDDNVLESRIINNENNNLNPDTIYKYLKIFNDTEFKKSIVKIAQPYCLIDNMGKSYGRNGNQEFNIIYNIAIITKKGILCSYDIKEPWLQDKAVEKYLKNYTPQLLESTIIYNNKEFSMNIDSLLYFPISPNFNFLKSRINSNLDIQLSNTIKPQWIIWVQENVHNNPITNNSNRYINHTSLSYETFIQDIDSEMTNYSPPFEYDAQIGYLVSFNTTERDPYIFNICGVLIKNQNQWISYYLND